MKKWFFIPACGLSAAAVGFVIFATGHPELSFPWDGWITGILYGLYADAVVLLFILAFCKKVTLHMVPKYEVVINRPDQKAISVLYAMAYSLKMSYMTD